MSNINDKPSGRCLGWEYAETDLPGFGDFEDIDERVVGEADLTKIMG
jgi:hypothetical protein